MPGECVTQSLAVFPGHTQNVLYRRTGLSQNFGFALAGLARPANPRGAFAPTFLPDFHPEQVCQDKGNYDSLLTPAVQLFRTGGPDLTIQACRLVEVFVETSGETL